MANLRSNKLPSPKHAGAVALGSRGGRPRSNDPGGSKANAMWNNETRMANKGSVSKPLPPDGFSIRPRINKTGDLSTLYRYTDNSPVYTSKPELMGRRRVNG